MTLGEKLKEARRQFGLSQEELAGKLCVSRAAVAKWEANNGLPDPQNLKAVSALLQVSADYLLDDGAAETKYVLREAVDLSKYGKGRKKAKRDRVVREKYPDAEIYTLLPRQKYTKADTAVDWAVGLLGGVFGVPAVVHGFRLAAAGEYYLAICGEKQLLVVVSDEHIESRELVQRVGKNKFETDDIRFTVCRRRLPPLE